MDDPANFRSAIGAYSTSGGYITGDVHIKATNIDRDASNPSADQTANAAFYIRDNNNEVIGRNYCVRRTNGRIDYGFIAANEKTDGTEVINVFRLQLMRDGTSSYFVTNAANFRSAIGAAASSDRRLKSNIRELGDEATDFIRELTPCEYDINEEHQVGLIAQDVYDADPWHTRMAFETEDGIDGLDDWERMEDGSPTWKLDYIRLLPPTISALQKALDRIDELEARVEELERML